MELTRKYLEAVDSITLQHSGCDCEVTGEWLAQDGDAIIKIDKCKCVERPIEGVGEAEKKKAIELLMRWYSRWENDDPNFHDGTLQCETEYFIGNSRASAPTVQGKRSKLELNSQTIKE